MNTRYALLVIDTRGKVLTVVACALFADCTCHAPEQLWNITWCFEPKSEQGLATVPGKCTPTPSDTAKDKSRAEACARHCGQPWEPDAGDPCQQRCVREAVLESSSCDTMRFDLAVPLPR